MRNRERTRRILLRTMGLCGIFSMSKNVEFGHFDGANDSVQQ